MKGFLHLSVRRLYSGWLLFPGSSAGSGHLSSAFITSAAPLLCICLTQQLPNGAAEEAGPVPMAYPSNTLIHIHAGAALMRLPTRARLSCGRSLNTASCSLDQRNVSH